MIVICNFSAFKISPLIGPGLVSTSPANTSNKDSVRNIDKRGVAHVVPRLTQAPHRPSLPGEEVTPFPASKTLVDTFVVR